MAELLSPLTEDPDFREHFRADPEAAASERGIELSQEEREALRALDTSGSDQEFAERLKALGRVVGPAPEASD